MTDVATPLPADIAGDPRTAQLRRVILCSIAAYFALHVGLRLLLSNSLVLDEAEQVLLSQELRWGYGSQPPLYTWLQTGVFAVLGTNLFALALVKNLLLFSSYLLMYLSVRRMAKGDLPGLEAALTLLFIPEISWEAQRDLTHSVLLLATTMLSLWAVVRVLETRQARWYLLLGAAAAGGILSKYNYPLFLIPVLLAALTVKPFRSAVLNWRMLLALAVLAALTSGHFHWAITHRHETLLQGNDFFNAKASRFTGLRLLVTGVLFYTAAVVAFYCVFFLRTVFRRPTDPENRPYESLLRRGFLIGLAALVVGVLAFHVSHLQARWLQPLMIMVPIWFALRVRNELTPKAVRGLAIIATLAGVTIIVALTLRTVRPSERALSRRPLNAPFDALVTQLRAAGFERGTIIAADKQVGGNLHLAFQDSRTIVPELFTLPSLSSGDVLIVWNPEEGIGYSDRAIKFAESRYGPRAGWPAEGFVEAPLKYAKRGTMRLDYILLKRN